MNGNNVLNNFSIPPPNLNQGVSSLNNAGKFNMESVASCSTYQPCFIPPFVQNNYNSPTQNSNGIYNNIHAMNNGNSYIAATPPPLPNYIGSPSVFNTQHMYPSTGLSTGLPHSGTHANTFTNHGYFPPPPPRMQHYLRPPPFPMPPRLSNSSIRSFYYAKNNQLAPLVITINRNKKKPISRSLPTRKDWSVAEAKAALELENEYYNKRKNTSLKITFPDLELTSVMVAAFHPSIDSVHFQQPSTPRSCVVILKDDVNTEELMERLSKTKFGDGYLKVETRDPYDGMKSSVEDIDPLTLYIGNLPAHVKKSTFFRLMQNPKRVDIGFAQKMRLTRYAFVTFRKAEDSSESFKSLFGIQLESQSCVVRFRRINDTIPFIPEPPQSRKRKSCENSAGEGQKNESTWNQVDTSQWNGDRRSVKTETSDDTCDWECEDIKNVYCNSEFIYLDDCHEHERKYKRQAISKLSMYKSEELPELNNGQLSPISSVHFKDEIPEDQILRNSPDTICSKRLKLSDEEVDAKPSDLVDQKPLLRCLKNMSLASARSLPIHKPFARMKIEDTESNRLGPILTAEIKSEVGEKWPVNNDLNVSSSLFKEKNRPKEVEKIKKDDVSPSGERQSEVQLNVSLERIKNEPIDQDEAVNEDDDNLFEYSGINFGNLLSRMDDKKQKLRELEGKKL